MNPKFEISKSKVLEQYEKVKVLCDTVSYSSKTNSVVTGILEKEKDCMFSIHIENELKNVKDLSRVLFFAQAWREEKIRDLIVQGINWFVVDNKNDLEILENFLEKNDPLAPEGVPRDISGEMSTKGINVLLRMKLQENTIKTEKYFVFGMGSDFVNKKLKELRENSKIGKLGVHFHRKTQNMAEWNLKYEFEDMISEENLKLIDVLNIGGGLPSEYANTNMNVLDSIYEKIKELRNFLKENKIDLMIEPGRFIAAGSGKLITKIIGIYENNIIVNASVYNSDMDALIVPVKLLVDGENKKGTAYVIKGITPCSLDLFRYKVYLENPKVGDELVFLNAGAYNFGSDFCDLGKVESEIIE